MIDGEGGARERRVGGPGLQNGRSYKAVWRKELALEKCRPHLAGWPQGAQRGDEGMVGPPIQGLGFYRLATRGGVRCTHLPRAILFRADGPLVSAASRGRSFLCAPVPPWFVSAPVPQDSVIAYIRQTDGVSTWKRPESL